MKSFRQFLTEAQWMYHGSPHEMTGGHFNPVGHNNDYEPLDRMIGMHFAADPTLAKKFISGELHYKPGQGGHLYKTKAPARSKLYKLWSFRGFDQSAIGSLVSGTVFSKPENKHMFISWVKHSRGIDDKLAHEIHAHLSQGKAPADPEKFGTAASKGSNTFRSYMHNFDSGLIMKPHPNFRAEVAQKFVDHMRERGYHGLVYKNTSPMETRGVRSKKCYIIFNPENHKLHKVE